MLTAVGELPNMFSSMLFIFPEILVVFLFCSFALLISLTLNMSNCNSYAYLSKHTVRLHQMNNFASGRSGVLYMTTWLTEHVITAVYHSSQQKVWRKIIYILSHPNKCETKGNWSVFCEMCYQIMYYYALYYEITQLKIQMREIKYVYCVNRFKLLIKLIFYFNVTHCIWQLQLA